MISLYMVSICLTALFLQAWLLLMLLFAFEDFLENRCSVKFLRKFTIIYVGLNFIFAVFSLWYDLIYMSK